MNSTTAWVIFGFVGQAAFSLRFFVQWVATERLGRSTIPIAFWYLSIVGGLILFSYAIHIRSEVFIVGQSLGVFVYSRNLMLIFRERRRARAAAQDTE